MAKELPYFKFDVAEYINGLITLESDSAQGLFINICAHYWFKSGKLSLTEIKRRLLKSKTEDFDALTSCGVIKVNDDMITITFLDDQLQERNALSKTNSANGRLGGRPKSETKPTAFNSVSESKANESNIEEKRVEESRKEEKIEKIPFQGEVLIAWNDWVKYRAERKQKLTPTTIRKQIQFLGWRAGPEIIAIINQSITNGWTGLFELKKNNNGIGNTTQGTTITTTAIIEPGKDFGVNKGFSRSGANGG